MTALFSSQALVEYSICTDVGSKFHVLLFKVQDPSTIKALGLYDLVPLLGLLAQIKVSVTCLHIGHLSFLNAG